MIELDDFNTGEALIKVVGVGGGGGNAVNTMIKADINGVEFLACNTDRQALAKNLATNKIHIGQTLTKGLGAGANPNVGREAAMEDSDLILEALEGADMVFVTAGMGGGTGTGGAPIIASIARSLGALTVGVVTKPFTFEGKKRIQYATTGIAELRNEVDTLVTIPNDKILLSSNQKKPLLEAFQDADTVLLNAVQGISDLITCHGIVNVDFADVRTIMTDQGMALMGTGRASGEDRGFVAATEAISSPFLEDVNIDGATAILINVTGGHQLSLHDINTASTLIKESADEDAQIIFGSVIEESMGDEIQITVIATGFDNHKSKKNRLLQGLPINKKEEDIPTIIRNRWEEEPFTRIPPKKEKEMSVQYDIPAFLRRKTNE